MYNFYRNFTNDLQFGYICKRGSHIIKRNSSTIMSNHLTLYGDYVSPPVRFVLTTAKLLNTELKFRDIDLFKSENKSEFYTKINPLQKVPALVVEDTVIRDSHAIALYLCRRNDQQDLYPNDALHKAQVDEMLYFNATTLFPIDSVILGGIFSRIWPPEESNINKAYKAIDYLESKLKMNKYLTGNKMMLGDLCCHQTMISLQVALPLQDRHVRVKEWMQDIEKNLPCNDINERGVNRLKNAIKGIGIDFDSKIN